MRFCKCLPVAFPSVTIHKTPFYRKNTFPLLLARIEFVKTPSCCKILICFPLTAWIISVIVRCYVLVFLGGPQVPKWAEIDQEIAFLVMKHKPLWKKPSHRFWQDYNLSKHLPVEIATFLRWEGVLMNWKCRKCWKKAFENNFSLQKNSQKSPKIV